MATKILYYGDNLEVLRKHIPDASVDLVYLDPPFNSKRSYNVLFKTKTGQESQAQISSFEDTWTWSQQSESLYQELVAGQGGSAKVSDAIEAMRQLLSPSDVLAYLVMMTARLVELHRKLKSTGALYLHCDPTASHYLKVILDSIFGPTQFRNEIIWRRTGAHNSPRRYGPIHDVLLFYTKSDSYFFDKVYRPYLKGHVNGYFKHEDKRGHYWTNALTGSGTRNGESGLPWKGYEPTKAGRHWAIPGKVAEEIGLDDELSVQQRLDALDQAGFIDHPPTGSDALPTYRQYLEKSPGTALQDIWAYQPHTRGVLHGTSEAIDEDVRWLVAQGDPERLGYQTQKPLGLLARIIKASCPPNGVVLDPFCGCGTACDAAEALGCQWIGIDVSYLAIDLVATRLHDRYGAALTFEIHGIPRDVQGAKALWDENPFDFERWAVSLVRGQPNEKQVGDKGIDGLIKIATGGGKAGRVLVSVKGGVSLNPAMVRDLIGAVDSWKAAMGVLITMEPPTAGMIDAANQSGVFSWEAMQEKYPKVQIITVEELLRGKRPHLPPVYAPYLKAQKLVDQAGQHDMVY